MVGNLEDLYIFYIVIIILFILGHFTFKFRDKKIKKLQDSIVKTLIHHGFHNDQALDIFESNKYKIIQMNNQKISLSMIASFFSDQYAKKKVKTTSTKTQFIADKKEETFIDKVALDNLSTKEIKNNFNESKSNNDKENYDNKVKRITTVIRETLYLQTMISGYEEGSLPEDNFVIGYLLGYSDSIEQWNDIDQNSTTGMTIIANTFFTQFGKKLGSIIFKKYLEIKSDVSEDIIEGAKIGGQDMHNFLMYGSEYSPMNLNAYLTGEEIYFKPPPQNS